MAIRGIIFDLDGTLLDTLPDITAGVNSARQALGLPDCPISDIRAWIGEGLPMLCQRALADAPDVPVERMVAAVSAYYSAHRIDWATLYPGIAKLLDALTARGIPIAILSNKPHEHTLPIAQALFSKWPWVAIEGYREEDRRKPDPRTAAEVIAAMGLAAGDVGLLGDSDTDMRTAVNAGMVPLGATWGYRDRETLIAGGAKYLIDTPMQVLELVA